MSALPSSHPGRCRTAPGSSATSCSSIPSSSPSSACRSCSRTAGCHRPGSVGSCGSRSPAWSPGRSRASCSTPRASRATRSATSSYRRHQPSSSSSFSRSSSGFGGAVIAVSQRYRRGGRIQRQQVKWLAADVALGSDPAAAGSPAHRRQPGAGQHAERPGHHRDVRPPGRDRDRDPALPPVRARSAHQPHPRLGDRDGAPGRSPRRWHRRPAGGAGTVHEREHHRGRGVDPRRVRPVPAASASRAAGGGPPLRPGAVRRAADGGRIRRAHQVRRGPRYRCGRRWQVDRRSRPFGRPGAAVWLSPRRTR